MKKILLILLIIIFPLIVFCQSGDGLSVSTAYYGTISTPQTWTNAYNGGIIYVGQSANPDLTIGTGGSLTIEAGVTIIFCRTNTDLIITGTGTITADGTPSNRITFTRDYPTNNYWGHISFEAMGTAGASLFDNCIIEYGDVSSFSIGDLHGGGGALFLDFNNVSVTNCIIRHNKAQWGGGIFVHISRNPSIKNCYFEGNLAIEAGGGLFLYNYSSSQVENSVFYNNHSNGASSADYTGGGVSAFSSSSKVVNCTFANNSSTRTNGQGIELYGSSGAQIINSIFWGSINQIYLADGTNGNTIINCAVQAAVPSGSINCITLNSSNSASDGPNFNATNGTDWSIKFISPCRDAGTAPSPTVPNDYLGNARIGTYDIGAYEVQYSRWLTNASAPTSWTSTGNWEQGFYPGLAGTTGDAVIPYLASDTYAPNISSLTISSTKYLILEPGAKATLSSLINNGILKLQSDATNISSLITNSSVTATVELFLTGGGTITDYKWHYISTPVSTLPVTTFTGVTLDLATYAEPRVSTDLLQGWVAFDGYVYATGGTDLNYDFTDLTPGKGYDYWDQLDQKFTFSGSLNVTNQAMALSYSGTANSGFNLLGNPFSSGLNWNSILSSGTYPYPANTSQGIYFTRNKTQCTYIGGVGIPADVTGIIPPMQGFFVKTSSTLNTINLDPAARTHTNIHARYKGDVIIPLVRLSLAEDTLSDETVVRFDAQAKSGLDYEFDASKIFFSPGNVGIYSEMAGTKYAINGQPFPDPLIEIPIVVNLTKDGVHSISSTQLQGLDDYNVYLTDNTTGFTANLKTSPAVTFSASTGLITDRFILKVGNITTGVENPLVISDNIFNVYSGNNNINIQTISDDWDGKSGSVRVLDLTGKTASDLQNVEFSKNSLVQVQSPAKTGLYVVEIRSGVRRYVGKVVIK